MSSQQKRLTDTGTAGASAAATAGASPAADPESSCCARFTRFDRRNFDNPTRIDNKFLPMKPGTQLTLDGRANRGGGALPHRVVFTVTDLTKVINRVRSMVAYDVDSNSGQISEAELAFFAQDNDGNVWNTGEYPEEYDNGRFVGAPNTWIAGLQDAEAGIHMLAAPKVGIPEYLQGRAPRIDFLDCAQVVKTGQRVRVPLDFYQNVLTIHERSPLAPDSGIQSKDHAPGVGIIRVGAFDDPEGETLVLVKATCLGPHALREVREDALKLDRRGSRISDVYSKTPPAQAPEG